MLALSLHDPVFIWSVSQDVCKVNHDMRVRGTVVADWSSVL